MEGGMAKDEGETTELRQTVASGRDSHAAGRDIQAAGRDLHKITTINVVQILPAATSGHDRVNSIGDGKLSGVFELDRLTDFDFETICKDAFECYLGAALTIHAPGNDKSVYLRCFSSSEVSAPLIVQCKHWANSNVAKLIRHLGESELPKINLLKPARYILATSLRLTQSVKDEIAAALCPHIRSTNDIFGLLDIIGLLDNHPEVVRRHMRLQLSNPVARQFLSNASQSIGSSDLGRAAERTALVYAPNPSYGRAEEILDSHHVCILSGIPGIGKTTLAQILALSYANHGFEIREISEDIGEIDTVWNEDTSQFFYYDDFLGQTALGDKLRKNEDARILRIMLRISRSANKRLVMTTREYIFEQARQQYERIATTNFNPSTCIVSIGDYTRFIRAEILYNHLYFSDLDSVDKACFADPNCYLPIISNPKFNPRLIDYSIRASTSKGLRGREVAKEVVENLTSPHRIWRHIIEHQLDLLQTQILVTLISLPPQVPLEGLREAVEAAWAADGHHIDDRSFRNAMKVLENTMIRSVARRDGSIVVQYHNPSIRDYMREYIFGSEQTLRAILRSTKYFAQPEQLMVYATNWPPAKALINRGEIRSEFAQALLRTIRGPDVRFPGRGGTSPEEVFRRNMVALKIASRLDSKKLEEQVEGWLSSVDLYDIWPNIDDVVDLAKEMLRSRSQSVRHLAYKMMRDFVRYLTEDASTWPDARAAHRALDEFYDLCTNSLILFEVFVLSPDVHRTILEGRDRMLERLQEEARDAIRFVASEGDVPDHLADDIEDMLEWAAAQAGRKVRTSFPGYSTAKRIATPSTRRSRVRPPETAPVNETFVEGVALTIERMFGMLKGERS
jgi:hypothetical protein